MVARTPPRVAPPRPPPQILLNPTLLRETLIKVDKSIARLQELQMTVTGGNKVISGVTLSPRSTRGYLKTSLRCKQESLRIKNLTARRSPPGKLPSNTGDWKRMSLPLWNQSHGSLQHLQLRAIHAPAHIQHSDQVNRRAVGRVLVEIHGGISAAIRHLRRRRRSLDSQNDSKSLVGPGHGHNRRIGTQTNLNIPRQILGRNLITWNRIHQEPLKLLDVVVLLACSFRN